MKSPARRFVLFMLVLTALLVGGPALLNYVVDPYDIFGNNRMGVYISAEREVKATEVARYPHNALLVGNSRMAMITPAELKGFRFFNGAFAGATADEVFWFIHHYARKQELVVLGVDLGMKDPPTTKGDIFQAPTWEATVENLFSLQTLEYSFKTIFSHWAGKPSHCGPDGAFENEGWIKRANRDDSALVQTQLEEMKRGYGSFVTPTPAQLSFYRRISEALRERGITCVVVVVPLHQAITRHIETGQLRDAYRAWLDELRSMFPHVVDLSASAYGSAENFYKADAGHFKPETGVRFINEAVVPVAERALRERGK